METVFRRLVVVLTTLSAAVACTSNSTPPPGDSPPIVIHATQPKSLEPDWADSAVKAAWGGCMRGQEARTMGLDDAER